jgi:hypothetical protein
MEEQGIRERKTLQQKCHTGIGKHGYPQPRTVSFFEEARIASSHHSPEVR